MSKKIDRTGERFGRLLVIREYGRDKHGNVLWLCRCLGKHGDDCGAETIVRSNDLRSGKTKSCGCLSREQTVSLHTTHGCKHEPWYKTYEAMMRRCGHFKGAQECDLCLYRDRGITVCEEWRNSPRAFGDWLLAHGWRKGLQIDRIDNDKGYYPDNCRVVTPKGNANNRRNTLRLDDGTPLAMFCTSIGINTREGERLTKKYNRIQMAWKRAHKPHPELMQALKEDTDKQSRLLEITKLKCRYAELMIEGIKKLTTSKSDTLDARAS